jgi:hypothetical protein
MIIIVSKQCYSRIRVSDQCHTEDDDVDDDVDDDAGDDDDFVGDNGDRDSDDDGHSD